MSTTPDHIPDAGKMMPTSEDYRFDLRFELALDEEAGYCPVARMGYRRALAAEQAILEWADASADIDFGEPMERLNRADDRLKAIASRSTAGRERALAARIREGREKGVRV